jgi:hypothetical protein
MAEKDPKVTFTESSVLEIDRVRPVSYTGPLMPRGTNKSQATVLVPDITKVFQTLMDKILKTTKEEPLSEVKQGVPEKTGIADYSEKKLERDIEKSMRNMRMDLKPYNKLFYDQCILEGCDPDTCFKKYFEEMS